MDGLTKITDRIAIDAKKDQEAIVAHAKLAADTQLKAHQIQAQELLDQAVEAGVRSAKILVQKRQSAAELEARKTILAVKQELVNRAFADALGVLAELPSEPYRALLIKLALEATQTGDESLILNEADCKSHGQGVVAAINDQLNRAGKRGSLTLSQETRPMMGGLILKAGQVETVCSLEALVNQSRNSLVSKVTKVLLDV